MAKNQDDAKGVKLRIPRDLAERFQALGDDWEDQVAAILRAHLDDGPHRNLGDRIAEAVAPLRDHPLAPHVEKAAKDFASKVAKDVAAAAGAAALAAWTAGLAKKDEDKPAKPAKPKA
jgi:hypothetical protein